jgi:hypothetical protein
MLTARRLTAPALLALSLVLAYLAGSAAAGARPAPPADGGYVGPTLPSPPTVVVTHTGSPVWTYVVVALAAAVLTLALAWAVTRFRHPQAHAATAA